MTQSPTDPRSSAAKASAANIRAVAFDGYGTLFDFTEPDFIASMAEICDQQGLDADAADIWRRFLRASYLMRAEHHHEPVYTRYDEAWAAQFQRVFKQMRLPGDAWAAANHLKAKLAGAPAFQEAHSVIHALPPPHPPALPSHPHPHFLP